MQQAQISMRGSELRQVLVIHIATLDNGHRPGYETYWFWTARGKNEHVRVLIFY